MSDQWDQLPLLFGGRINIIETNVLPRNFGVFLFILVIFPDIWLTVLPGLDKISMYKDKLQQHRQHGGLSLSNL